MSVRPIAHPAAHLAICPAVHHADLLNHQSRHQYEDDAPGEASGQPLLLVHDVVDADQTDARLASPGERVSRLLLKQGRRGRA